jgi:hypothetical protein
VLTLPEARAGRRLLAWSCGFATFAFASSDAGAAALGGLVTSVGVFAALAAVFSVKLSPMVPPVPALPAGLVVLIVGAGTVWLVRARIAPWLRGGVATAPHAVARRHVAGIARKAPALPASVDREALLTALRSRFVALQLAWDRGDLDAVRALTTPGMFDELNGERVRSGGPETQPGLTEVVTLNAELIGYEVWPEACVASVEFTGLMRESAGAGAVPFRELWMLTQSNPGPGDWCLARHQALL